MKKKLEAFVNQQVNLSRRSYITTFMFLFITTLLVAIVFLIFSLTKYNERVVSVGSDTYDAIHSTTVERFQNLINSQWTVLDSFSAFLNHDNEIDEHEILYYMDANRKLWDLKEIALSTETGRHFNSWGNEFFLDEDRNLISRPTSDMWYGRDDTMYLVHPITSKTTFRHEQITVVSASETISTLICTIAPVDFNGQMQIYLMTEKGIKLNDDPHISAFSDENLISFFETQQPRLYKGPYYSLTTAISKQESWIGTIIVNGKKFYVGCTPVSHTDTTLYLVTAVEASYVNQTNILYGRHILLLSLTLISLSLAVALLSFLTFHHKNKEYVEDLLLTTRQEGDDKLEAALELAQQSNAAKTAFLSSMSHDIRTPMNAIINMTDFALKEIDNREKLVEYLNIIRTSSKHLLHLINDVLDMTHIESGKMILKHEPFNLYAVTDDVSKIISAAASKKKITFSSRIISLTHADLYGDELRLQQVLINLLNNAIKFTNEGGTVVFTIEEIPCNKHSYQGYRFIITDTGCGISPETIDTIFEPFRRIENKGPKIEGSGLGLAITKSIVDAMNGEITVQSTPDVGSIFTVRMFFETEGADDQKTAESVQAEAAPEAEVVSAPTVTDFHGIRVLVAEDISLNQQILEHLMTNLNIVCDFADTGKECVEKFTNSDPFWYSLIFMDIQMPEMNGYEATRAIRLSNHPQSDIIPIVAMTANVFDEDVDRCHAAGMNAHLGKPIDPEAMRRTIASLI